MDRNARPTTGAGRSSACKTCRQRGRQCDQQYPVCRRCIRARLACGGYEDHVVVVHRTAPPDPDHERHLASPKGAQGLEILGPSLHRSSLRSRYFDAAWSSLRGSVGDSPSHLWIIEFPAVHVSDTALHAAFAAVAFLRVGQSEDSPDLMRQGQDAYARALSRTNARLSKPRVIWTDETLACILLLALYEAVRGSIRGELPSMTMHLEAARRFVQHRGPSSFRSHAGCVMLADLQRTSILDAIGRRESTLFCTNPWLQAMRKGSVESAQDELDDIFAQYPQAMHEFSALKMREPSDIAVSDVMRIHSLYKDLKDRLARWRLCVDTDRDVRYEPSVLLDPHVDQHLVARVPQTLHHARSLDAKLHKTYLTMQLILQLEILQLCQFAAQCPAIRSPETTAVGQPVEMSNTKEAAHTSSEIRQLQNPTRALRLAQKYCGEIVESTEQSLLPASGVLTAAAATFSIVVAIGFLHAQNDPRLEYMIALTKRFQDRSGYPLYDTIASVMPRA